MSNIMDIDMDIVFPDEEGFEHIAHQYQQLLMLYASAIQFVMMRLNLIKRECELQQMRAQICTITSRIKSPQSVRQTFVLLYIYLSLEPFGEFHFDSGTVVMSRYLQTVVGVVFPPTCPIGAQ